MLVKVERKKTIYELTRSLVGVKICLHVMGKIIAKYRSVQMIIRMNIEAV